MLLSAVVFWLLPRRFRAAFLSLVSLGLLLAIEPGSVLALVGWSILFYRLAPLGRERLWVPALVLGVLGWLAFHKYVPPLFAAIAGGGNGADLVIPLGISYYTFKLIHYALEVRRGTLPEHDLRDFACWILLAPIFSAGPIQRFDRFLAEREERLGRDAVVNGLTRIVHGLVKKLALGWAVVWVLQRFGGTEHAIRYLDEISTARAWFVCGLVYLGVYLDFSAYTDLAIGTSRLFGFRIMENFHWPIFATSIGRFWTRWHMTLAGWCQSYIYMPLIGLTRNPYLAVYATFTAIGLWHAGSLTFLLWGLYHSTGVAVYHLWRRRLRGRLPRWLPGPVGGWVLTQLFVIGSFAITLPGAAHNGTAGLRVLAKLVFLDVG